MSEWRRARHCDSNGCVEVQDAGSQVFLRSSEAPHNTAWLSRREWQEFVAAVKRGDFDDVA
jgi:uncharacterized protein DUF397